MKCYIIDLTAWSLVGLAGALGTYAIYLWDVRLAPEIAKNIVHLFVE